MGGILSYIVKTLNDQCYIVRMLLYIVKTLEDV